MSNGLLRRTLLASAVVLLISTPAWQAVAEPFNLFNVFSARSVDLKTHECSECGCAHGADEECITRRAVQKCVVGKKEVFDSTIRYECVSIPETRYHWKTRLITKEIPCPYCMPVCKTEDGERCFGEETWEAECNECVQLHCKHIEQRLEKAPCKHCGREPGETTIKVKYWSCVKEPYIVYRQVKRPVCVKQPRYEKVNVSITKYVCENCNGGGCGQCNGGCSLCNGQGCDYCSP